MNAELGRPARRHRDAPPIGHIADHQTLPDHPNLHAHTCRFPYGEPAEHPGELSR